MPTIEFPDYYQLVEVIVPDPEVKERLEKEWHVCTACKPKPKPKKKKDAPQGA